MAIGHVFYNFIVLSRNYHFQICPANSMETLPLSQYQAPELGPQWRQSFQDLVLSQHSANPVQQCLYSCFDTHGYLGRTGQDIGVFPGLPSNRESWQANRKSAIAFWWGYLALAALTLFVDDNHRQGSHRAGTMTFSRQLIWSGKPRKVDTLASLRIFSQICGAAAYVGGVGKAAFNDYEAIPIADEPFSAVGQWSSVACVLLVFTAAVVCKISQKQGVASSVGTDDETVVEVWDHRCGYAS